MPCLTRRPIFVTYLTVYSGDRMPPFYIGSSSLQRIVTGYRGSVCSKEFKSVWIAELRDHPHLFKTIVLDVHESRQDALQYEFELQTRLGVVKSDLFINKSTATVNGFLGMDVRGYRNPMFGKSRPDMIGKFPVLPATQRAKISKTRILRKVAVGSNNPMFGRTRPDTSAWISLMNRENNPMKTQACRDKMSLRVSGTGNPIFGKVAPQVSCLNCHRYGQLRNMKRWHFERCRFWEI